MTGMAGCGLKWLEMAGKGLEGHGLITVFWEYRIYKLRDLELGDFRLGPAKPGLFL